MWRRVPRGAGGVRALPAAARGHRRRGRHARALVRGAGAADRGRRRPAAGHVPRLLPPARLGLRDPHARTGSPRSRRLRPGRRARAPAACTSTTRRRARLEPRPPRGPAGRARSAPDGLCSVPVGAALRGAARACSRGPGAKGKARRRRRHRRRRSSCASRACGPGAPVRVGGPPAALAPAPGRVRVRADVHGQRRPPAARRRGTLVVRVG